MLGNFTELELIDNGSDRFDAMIVDPSTLEAVCFCDGEEVAVDLLLKSGYHYDRHSKTFKK